MACAAANGEAGRGAAGGQWAGRGAWPAAVGVSGAGDSSRVLMMAVNKGAGGGDTATRPRGGGKGLRGGHPAVRRVLRGPRSRPPKGAPLPLSAVGGRGGDLRRTPIPPPARRPPPLSAGGSPAPASAAPQLSLC